MILHKLQQLNCVVDYDFFLDALETVVFDLEVVVTGVVGLAQEDVAEVGRRVAEEGRGGRVGGGGWAVHIRGAVEIVDRVELVVGYKKK